MRQITITLPDPLFEQLEIESAKVHELGFTAATFAQELIESEMASRRLPVRMPITTEGLERKADPMEAFND